jgi:hypothetical protein
MDGYVPVHICTNNTANENMSIFGVYRPVSTWRFATQGEARRGNGQLGCHTRPEVTLEKQYVPPAQHDAPLAQRTQQHRELLSADR